MSYVSHADLGGKPVAAHVIPEPEGDPFHARWEARIHVLTLAMGATGLWNIDMSRAARETLADYRQLSYYEIWYHALVALLERRGLVTARELESGRSLEAPRPLPRVLAAAVVMPMLRAGAPTERAVAHPARFDVGDRVRAQPDAACGHTRLPGYARGRRGVVESVRGAHVFPDAHAAGRGEQPDWLYTVVFDSTELFGGTPTNEPHRVSIDAWEAYLEPA
jgi:nitrile hydratase